MIVNLHLNPPEGQDERFDTLVSPAGTVATLLRIEEELGREDSVGIDEAYPGTEAMKSEVRRIIRSDQEEGTQTVLLFTVLLYNAEKSLSYIRELKEEFGEQILTVVGGQLVPYAKDAYERNEFIDSVCLGDAEIILPDLLRDAASGGVHPFYEGWVKNSESKRFSGVSYERFFGIEERLREQERTAGFSQLTVQGPGGPGCAWAANNPKGPCSFCSLQNITVMNERSLQEAIEEERRLQERFHPDRLFDAANQFLPFLKPSEVHAWLREQIRLRKENGVLIEKYVYLTVSSVTEETARLLREAGVVEVYLGVDHFDDQALREENKSGSSKVLKRCLDALSSQGIDFRIGLVVGAARETTESLESIRRGVEWVHSGYKNHLKAVGVFPVEMLPGSKVFEEMESSGSCPEIFASFHEKGALSREEQRKLTAAFIGERGEVSMREVEALEAEISRRFSESGIVEYTVDRTPEQRSSQKRVGGRIPPR